MDADGNAALAGPRLPQQPWALEVADLAAELGVEPARGLPSAEATARLASFGRDELVEAKRRSSAVLFAAQCGTATD